MNNQNMLSTNLLLGSKPKFVLFYLLETQVSSVASLTSFQLWWEGREIVLSLKPYFKPLANKIVQIFSNDRLYYYIKF